VVEDPDMGLRLFTPGHGLHAGDETAFLDDQFVVGGRAMEKGMSQG
jgi:hypothetical protein